jgi:hypothetical protein
MGDARLSAADVAARMPALLARFGHGGDATPMLIAGCNVDTSKLPQGPGIPPLPVPSINHTIARCETCREQIWLGPKQLRARGVRICYICLWIVTAGEGTSPIVALDPDADSVPRRW